MLNRRAVSRYHLVRPLHGYIEHGDVRRFSEIVELSTAGFRVRLRNAAREDFTAPAGGSDFGEVLHEEDEIAGFGEIRYVRSDQDDLWIGFKWDDFHVGENIHKSFCLIAELISKGIAGCVNARDEVIQLGGHVSSVLADDLQQHIARGFRRVSLRDCASIDASGVSMLAGLKSPDLRLEEVSPEVSQLLRKHRLQGQSVTPH